VGVKGGTGKSLRKGKRWGGDDLVGGWGEKERSAREGGFVKGEGSEKEGCGPISGERRRELG